MASITCGKCKSTHGSVAEVRDCYAGLIQAPLIADRASRIIPDEQAVKIERHDRRYVRREPVTEAGMYRLDGTIYKVQRAVHGSGNLYAKELLVEGGHVNFVYAKGMIRRLSASDRMSLEEAKEFGALYGSCCVCGRTLTNETSIEAGIGPVCAGKL
jgi:hypothetical protein